jgi:hypothetical protein
MATFLCHCANTSRRVQDWVADDPSDYPDDDTEAFQSLACLACTGVHLVNPKTGKVLGADDE